MPISQPSQYQCDNMKKGDIIYVRKRNLLYRLYRFLFNKNKKKLLVRKDWTKPKPDYNEYYQEDCTLIYEYELKCVQSYKLQVPYVVSYRKLNPFKTGVLKNVEVGLYNIILEFNNSTITIPTSFIQKGIETNIKVFQDLRDNEEITDLIRFGKYTGNKFKKIVQERDISKWEASYCVICGKPVILKFNDNDIDIENTCTCGNIKINKNKFTYDEFALWFTCQTDKNIVKHYKQFWFKDKE